MSVSPFRGLDIYTKMDNFNDSSAVNLDDDDDEYVNYSVSDEESDSVDHDDPVDHMVDENVADGAKSQLGSKKRNMIPVSEMTADDKRGMEFASVEEAYDFYKKYAKSVGFSIRIDDVARDARKKVVMRQFVCNKQGSRKMEHITRVDRKRDHRPLTRVGCNARLRVRFNQKYEKWVVISFEEGHNHELTPSRYVHLYPAHRAMTDADRAQVDGLQSHGIKTCHIMGYMVAQKGGYAGVGFSRKDLYNYFDSKMRSAITDEDVVVASSYLDGKAGSDSMLYCKFSTKINGSLNMLFWADAHSRNDFHCFSDVIAFDTTYKKTKYNYPLVIFSGCNHHSQTIILGDALVADETIETYKWVLNCFLEAMGKPKAIVTDGDQAMREAIKQVFPEAYHRLCAWHLHKNACENVKIPAFLEDFKNAMYKNFTPEEFEEFWIEIVQKYELEGNNWVSKTYDNRFLWATAYFRNKFFARIRTTSQCEAINSIMKTYVRKKCSIYELVQNFEQALKGYRNNELVADFKSQFTEPVLTTPLRKIEKHAANIYTHEIFKEVKAQILKSGALVVTDRVVDGENVNLKLTKFDDTSVEKKVSYDTSKLVFSCTCRRFESRGIPCSHIFCAMKEEHIVQIPSSLILNRWTKNATTAVTSLDSSNGIDSNAMEVARFGAYSSACTKFCKVASKHKGRFNDIMDDLLRLTEKYDKTDDTVGIQSQSMKHVGDPNMVKTKGAPKKKKFGNMKMRHCSNCSSIKHNARTCPERIDVDGKIINEDQASDSESSEFVRDEVDCKVKRKLSGSCLQKQKKTKELTQNSDHDRMIKSVGCSGGTHTDMSQVHPMFQPMQFPTYGHATPSQGLVGGTVYPMFQPMQFPTHSYATPRQGLVGGANVSTHNAQVPTSCFGLLQQVMGKAG